MKRMDPYIAEVFTEPPLIAYKRHANLTDKLIRASLNKPSNRPQRCQPGMKNCLKQFCGSCPYIKEEKEIKHKKGKWKILKEVNCETTICIYLIECIKERCRQQYIGETSRNIRTRIMEQRLHKQ